MDTQTIPYDRSELWDVLSLLNREHRTRVAVGVETNRIRHKMDLHAAIDATAATEAVNATLLGADAETVADLRMAVWAVGLAGAGLL